MSFGFAELTLFYALNMINTLLGIKKNMTSTYDSRGRRVGATVVEIQPNFVTQLKTASGKDGYDALQLGYGTKKSVKKPQLGHAKKIGVERPIRWFREIKGDQGNGEDTKPGIAIKLDQVFSIGDAVKVQGTSKGKGFQGGVRRHGFHGGPKTHGQSDRHRAPGSIGSGTTPGRVYKGKKMAGHMGVERVSYKGMEIISVDQLNNTVTIKGGIPGFAGGLVIIEKTGKIPGYTPPPQSNAVDTSDVSPEEKPSDDESTRADSQQSTDKEQESEEKEKEQKQEEVKKEDENAS